MSSTFFFSPNNTTVNTNLLALTVARRDKSGRRLPRRGEFASFSLRFETARINRFFQVSIEEIIQATRLNLKTLARRYRSCVWCFSIYLRHAKIIFPLLLPGETYLLKIVLSWLHPVTMLPMASSGAVIPSAGEWTELAAC